MRGVLMPGGTIGILGGGQLGRMLAQAATRMGYRVAVFDPSVAAPAFAAAERRIVGDFTDLGAVRAFASTVDVVTFEFESVPRAAAEAASEAAPVRPSPAILGLSQHRLAEKEYLGNAGFTVAEFRAVRGPGELAGAVVEVGLPGILKSARSGYDGKAQAAIWEHTSLPDAWNAVGGEEAIFEKRVSLAAELSVIVARNPSGKMAVMGPFGNRHENHILDMTVFPAPLPERVGAQAIVMAQELAESLKLEGVLCVEFFWTREGELLVNELAPRPHNSGHITIELCVASQFEQQVRAICGLPPGSAAIRAPAGAMGNLLGELWAEGEPAWDGVLAIPGITLHLYGKSAARPGRKMGHLSALGPEPGSVMALVTRAREALVPGHWRGSVGHSATRFQVDPSSGRNGESV